MSETEKILARVCESILNILDDSLALAELSRGEGGEGKERLDISKGLLESFWAQA